MSNVARISDRISCGDFIAQGSLNVYASGMPVSIESRPRTTGHGCYPPTIVIGPFSETVFVNNSPVSLKGKTKIKPHRCGRHAHGGIVVTASDTVSIEA